MRIYFIRHGDPNYKQDDLTLRGLAQAEALAEFLADEGLTHLYTSPMGRARRAAEPTARRTGLTPVVLPWVHELACKRYEHPAFKPSVPFNLPGELLFAHSPYPLYEGWEAQPHFDDPHIVEQIEDMRKGSDALLAAHGFVREGALYRCDNPAPARIAVFCHQGMGTTWLAHLLNLPIAAVWAGFFQACTSYTTLVMEQYGGPWATPRMIAMGETAHLRLAGLPVSLQGLRVHE